MITDKAIREIVHIEYGSSRPIHSPESDAARSAILKLYSYETPLYGALNQANQWQDKDKVKSLGPFALLLYNTL